MRVSLLAAIATSALILSACGSSAPEASSLDPTPETATQETTSDEAPTAEAAQEAAAEEAKAETDSAQEDPGSEDPEDEAADDEPSGDLGLGGAGDLGEYTVVVTEVQPDATETIQQVNQFNEAPTGQYVLVSLAVTYTGEEEGDPWLDLTIDLAGSDSRIYDASSCMAVTPNPVMDVPTLTTGGTAEFDVCFDVPTDAVEAPKIHVEESFSFNDARLIWDPATSAPEGDTSAAKDGEPDDGPKSPRVEDALSIGAEADLADYTVSVTEVQLNANDAIRQANEFNDDPTGQYVLVNLAVTYTGDDEGDPWLDLSVELAGSDSRIYDSSSCWAVTPNPVMDLPTLTAGGTAEFDICFDVPADALQDPQIYVEESLSFDDTRVVWESQK